MFRFGKYCRRLNSRRWMETEEQERLQARARFWLAAAGGLLAMAVLAIIVGIILQ